MCVSVCVCGVGAVGLVTVCVCVCVCIENGQRKQTLKTGMSLRLGCRKRSFLGIGLLRLMLWHPQ